MIKHLNLAWQRIRRSPYQAISAISIMTMSLFLAGFFVILAMGSNLVLKYFETRPQINGFFQIDLTPSSDQVNLITSHLTNTGLVESVRYISKEDALKIYKDLNQNDPLLTEAVTANLLPASVEISAKNPRDLKQLADILKKEPGIEDVRFAEDVVGTLNRWISSIRTTGAVLVGIHIFITFTVILLVVGIKVSGRRDEISLLQLVGATPAYISAPFIFEGIIYGVLGAVLAWGISYLVILYSTGFWAGFLSGIVTLPPSPTSMISLLGGLVGLGTLVGGFGGAMAVYRFLKG
ncbi:hypothetical protein A2634_05190 [Candidatus Amesbacteria bacterium RIFCSPHIGHO2_01_FULL_48_32]|uniref:Cell division protein FtsX n=1 Tax=Candidatus Amesbacteria bacterium RIFCSPLOWO2_01_FULL_48_25 TaxID=1797259 RepID=A0A1F4ZCM8_9BACT|nr:MAG: hypothetical protein A2634_05190 [Candidatus Amesbacteria bacterium RIFCSPHIGHO2_01_FULL_48_32]OGD04063.1 MAG: hypothetical protein A2989_01535 [Candidatus Amesbacteria bacterium RIFCSPLOWO2_01_FULL_48_25]HJZ05673.1 permease-like cell division protein FtsX [Patescibacteria group bacterium]